MNRIIALLAFLLVILVYSPDALAEQPLKVATKNAPPFSMKGPDGEWRGISIEMWRDIAEQLELDYELHETTLNEMLAGLEDGTYEAAVAALTVTSEREKVIDFSHPFYTAGLGIATRATKSGKWLPVVQILFSWDFFKALFAIFPAMLLFAIVVWFFERRANPEQFDGKKDKGLLHALWWSAVTMTTVGYGDKAPSTFPGRIFGGIWMFFGIIVISVFTASITTTLTTESLRANVSSLSDLHRVTVSTLADSTSARFLEQLRVRNVIESRTNLDAIGELMDGNAEAVVYDAPILKYMVKQRSLEDVMVISVPEGKQHYGIGLGQGSPYRESINRALLTYTNSDKWQRLVRKYLGE
ncbi:MAG: transporter substrate-binding domain-containing protein [Planctomycetota bacterium]|nr:transporter substrate-binding domain-containing protein [Planctomycetota bacterium]